MKKVHGIASRIVTLKLGRGAFGVPWFSRAIDCHLPTIDESPLFDDFYLGKGRAAALVTLVSVGGLSKEDAAARAGQIGLWTHAIERRLPTQNRAARRFMDRRPRAPRGVPTLPGGCQRGRRYRTLLLPRER